MSSRDIPGFANFSEEIRFRLLAWGAACPIPNKVWADYQAMGKGALDWLMNRYETTNAVTRRVIWDTAAVRNPALHAQLTTPSPRLADEPVGNFEYESVPLIHTIRLSPMSTQPGYAGSRVLILATGTDQADEILHSPEKMQVVEQAIDMARTPDELLAYFALAAFNAGANPGTIIEHTFEVAKLHEEGNARMFRDLYQTVSRIAPVLVRAWRIMDHLAPPHRRSETYFQQHYNYNPKRPNSSLTAFFGSPQRLRNMSLTMD